MEKTNKPLSHSTMKWTRCVLGVWWVHREFSDVHYSCYFHMNAFHIKKSNLHFTIFPLFSWEPSHPLTMQTRWNPTFFQGPMDPARTLAHCVKWATQCRYEENGVLHWQLVHLKVNNNRSTLGDSHHNVKEQGSASLLQNFTQQSHAHIFTGFTSSSMPLCLSLPISLSSFVKLTTLNPSWWWTDENLFCWRKKSTDNWLKRQSIEKTIHCHTICWLNNIWYVVCCLSKWLIHLLTTFDTLHIYIIYICLSLVVVHIFIFTFLSQFTWFFNKQSFRWLS